MGSLVHYILTGQCPPHRPLSQRLDRCDRVIQNESSDPNGANGRIRLVKFRPSILGSAHLRTVKMLLSEAGQSNGKFCPLSNWKHDDLD